jgi:hypothetical protein
MILRTAPSDWMLRDRKSAAHPKAAGPVQNDSHHTCARAYLFMEALETVVRAHALAMTFRQRKHCQSIFQCLPHPLYELGETSMPFLHQLVSSLPCSISIWGDVEDPDQGRHHAARSALRLSPSSAPLKRHCPDSESDTFAISLEGNISGALSSVQDARRIPYTAPSWHPVLGVSNPQTPHSRCLLLP